MWEMRQQNRIKKIFGTGVLNRMSEKVVNATLYSVTILILKFSSILLHLKHTNISTLTPYSKQFLL